MRQIDYLEKEAVRNSKVSYATANAGSAATVTLSPADENHRHRVKRIDASYDDAAVTGVLTVKSTHDPENRLASPLVPGTVYFVANEDATHIKLAPTLEAAISGDVIALGDAGSGDWELDDAYDAAYPDAAGKVCPYPIVIGRKYYVINVDSTTICLATTHSNAMAGTVVNLSAAEATYDGTMEFVDPALGFEAETLTEAEFAFDASGEITVTQDIPTGTAVTFTSTTDHTAIATESGNATDVSPAGNTYVVVNDIPTGTPVVIALAGADAGVITTVASKHIHGSGAIDFTELVGEDFGDSLKPGTVTIDVTLSAVTSKVPMLTVQSFEVRK